jgi:hypothetical protein
VAQQQDWDITEYLSRPYAHPTLVHDALGYEAPGLRVIPLGTRAKHPWMERWPERASCDPDQVVRWFEMWPNSNIGVATGRGFFTLDVDPGNGGDQSLRRMLGRRRLPTTAEALTGSGGKHYLFRYDPQLWIGDRSGMLPGVDLKGEGGQFVVEPSIRPRTRREYVWLIEPRRVIAEAPGWLLGKIAELVGDRRALTGDAAPLVLDRSGPVGGLVAEVVQRFPVTAVGQRNAVMSKVIASLLGRSHDAELARQVVMGWYDHYKALGLIRTGRDEAERAAIANIWGTIREGKIRPARSGIDHRANIAKLELSEGQKDLIREGVSLGSDLFIPKNPPPPCKSMTSSQERAARLCKTPQEFAFVESFVAYLTDKVLNRGEATPKVIGEHIKQAVLDRHQIRIDDQQLDRLKRKYMRREGKPASRFELVVQITTGYPGTPSELELTGVLRLM